MSHSIRTPVDQVHWSGLCRARSSQLSDTRISVGKVAFRSARAVDRTGCLMIESFGDWPRQDMRKQYVFAWISPVASVVFWRTHVEARPRFQHMCRTVCQVRERYNVISRYCAGLDTHCSCPPKNAKLHRAILVLLTRYDRASGV